MKPYSLPLFGIVFTLVLVGVYLYNPSIYDGISISRYFIDMIESASPITVYVIVFLVTLISSASIIIVIPYPIVIMYAIKSNVNLVILAIVASLAAALGEISGYAAGVLGRKITEKYMAFYIKLRGALERNKWKVYLAVFFAAMTPISDDIIMVPLGLARFGFIRALLPCFLGKLILITVIIVFSDLLINTIGGNSIISDLATIWLIIGIMYMAMRSNGKASIKQLEKIIGV